MNRRRNTQKTEQLTVRGVPAEVKRLLARRANAEQKSLNAVLVEVLTAAVGRGKSDVVYTDLDHLAGRWVEDPEFESAIRMQDQIDHDLWK